MYRRISEKVMLWKLSLQEVENHPLGINSFITEVLSYRNQSIDLQSKLMDWFLYDKDLRHESYT